MKTSYKFLTTISVFGAIGFTPNMVFACDGCREDMTQDDENTTYVLSVDMATTNDSVVDDLTNNIENVINDIIDENQNELDVVKDNLDSVTEDYTVVKNKVNDITDEVALEESDYYNTSTEISNNESNLNVKFVDITEEFDATKILYTECTHEESKWNDTTTVDFSVSEKVNDFGDIFVDSRETFKYDFDKAITAYKDLETAVNTYKVNFNEDEYNNTVSKIEMPTINYNDMIEATNALIEKLNTVPDTTDWINSLNDCKTKVEDLQKLNIEGAFTELGTLKEKYKAKKDLENTIEAKKKELAEAEDVFNKVKEEYNKKKPELEKQLEEAKIALEKAQNIQKSVSEGLYFTVPNDPTYDHFNELVQAYLDYMDSIADTNKPSEEQPEVNDTVTVIEIPANDIMQADDYKPLNSVSTQAVVSNDNLSTATGTNFAGTMMGMTTALGGMLLTGKKRKNEKDC